METKFNDEQLAPETNFNQMAQKYAKLAERNYNVHVMQEEGLSQENLIPLAKGVELSGILLKNYSQKTSFSKQKELYEKFANINAIELAELIEKFGINDFNKQNPVQNIKNVNNFLQIKTNIVKQEMENIASFINVLKNESSNDRQNWLNNTIIRRLEMIEIMMN